MIQGAFQCHPKCTLCGVNGVKSKRHHAGDYAEVSYDDQQSSIARSSTLRYAESEHTNISVPESCAADASPSQRTNGSATAVSAEPAPHKWVARPFQSSFPFEEGSELARMEAEWVEKIDDSGGPKTRYGAFYQRGDWIIAQVWGPQAASAFCC